jgi:ATP-binding cassette subfamily B (MDR/TAP) protein 1
MRLMHLPTDTDEGRGMLQPVISGPITFNNVSFAYPERPDAQVLKNASFEIDDGECVAIVGASGSGKSTVASLLQRLYEPDSGKIYVGADRVQAISVDHLRAHVSVVSQNPTLFDATVAENIAYGNDGLSTQAVEAAARAANVHDFIMSLPKGYDTALGEKASLISGGQAQRLQIARALARPCKVLVLDECTSALDAANQAAIMETIQRAKVGRTTVVITHKVQMMRMCDRILVVREGEIVESGPYDELMAQNGVFATLARGGEWSAD